MTGTCSWAACDKPATAVADTWLMCRPHLAEHHTLAAEEHRPAALDELDAAVRDLNRRGWTDRQMANATGTTWTQVRNRRRKMGLRSTSATPAGCGTRSGFARHRAANEPPCSECRNAQRTYDAARYKARRAA